MLQRSKDYIGGPAMLRFIVNYDQFNPDKYGDGKFVKKAKTFE
jgi:hypothetical protein